MEINVAIGGGQKVKLNGAILVYQGGHEAFAAWHPARPQTTAQRRIWARQNR